MGNWERNWQLSVRADTRIIFTFSAGDVSHEKGGWHDGVLWKGEGGGDGGGCRVSEFTLTINMGLSEGEGGEKCLVSSRVWLTHSFVCTQTFSAHCVEEVLSNFHEYLHIMDWPVGAGSSTALRERERSSFCPWHPRKKESLAILKSVCS